MPVDTQTLTQPFENLLVTLVAAIPGIIAAVVIFFLTLYVAGLLSRTVRRSLEARQTSFQAVLLISKISYWTVMITGLIAALQQVGFNPTAFLTGLGIAGFTIGFALQDISKNFIAGLILLIQQPFKVGQAVQLAGIAGTVIAVDLRSTEVHTWDGQVVLIPNASILTNPITNYSRASSRRVEIALGISYASDMELARQTALNAIRGIEGLLSDPAPQVLFQNFGNSTVNLSLYFWVNTSTSDPFKAKDRAMLSVYAAYQQAGIELPYPIQTVLLPDGTSGR